MASRGAFLCSPFRHVMVEFICHLHGYKLLETNILLKIDVKMYLVLEPCAKGIKKEQILRLPCILGLFLAIFVLRYC